LSPLAIELFAGTGSGTAGWCALGGRAVCFDLEYLPHHGNPHAGQHRVIQDVLTLQGSQFRDAAFIWASPPCQQYSYLAMPWSRSKVPENSKKAKALRKKWETEGPDNRLFDACFRIQREAIEATEKICGACEGTGREDDEFGYTCDNCGGLGWTERRYIPLIVENVRGAIPWVGPSKARYGSFHLWGDVEMVGNRIFVADEWKRSGTGLRAPSDRSQKREGRNFHTWERTGGLISSSAYNGADHEMRGVGLGVKTIAHVNKRDGYGHTRHLTNQAEHDAVRESGTKIGGDWFSDPNSTCRKHGSRSNARKAASAMIARIPAPLSEHVARAFWTLTIDSIVPESAAW
jgi:hypothetical protein